MYSKKVLEHFRHPQNVGEIKDADGIGKVGNLYCGDLMECFIKIGKGKQGQEIIKDVKMRTMGCVAALATSSITSEIAKGKTIEEAIKMTKATIVEGLQGLPPTKIHCSVLSTDALKEAVYDYLKKNGRPIPEELEKTHKRIVREIELINEKYKDYSKLGEEAMK